MVANASATNPKLHVAKEVGKFAILRVVLETEPLPPATTIIEHTRWVTRGGATHENVHPYLFFDGKLALIHNEIIENADTYRTYLQAIGIIVVSETGTGVIAHLLEHAFLAELKPKDEREKSVFPATVTLRDVNPENRHLPNAIQPMRAMNRVTRNLEGSFTLLATYEEALGVIVTARRFSPLVVGLGRGTNYLGSDILAFTNKTKQALKIN